MLKDFYGSMVSLTANNINKSIVYFSFFFILPDKDVQNFFRIKNSLNKILFYFWIQPMAFLVKSTFYLHASYQISPRTVLK